MSYRPSYRFIVCLIVLITIAFLLLGCTDGKRKGPDLPAVVDNVIEVPMKLDRAFLEPVTKPMPTDGTVGARAISHEQRGDVIDYYHCLQRLLAGIQDGKKPDPKECKR